MGSEGSLGFNWGVISPPSFFKKLRPLARDLENLERIGVFKRGLINLFYNGIFFNFKNTLSGEI